MKICFYSPYLPKHFGGGEKHLLDVARIAANKHQVFIAIHQNSVSSESQLSEYKAAYQAFFGQDLSKLTFIATPLGSSENFAAKALWTKSFDAMYYVTDGSFFLSLAPKNYLHIQVPLKNIRVGLAAKLKLWNWHHVNTNSEFTKNIVEKYWGLPVTVVLNPLVEVMQPSKKIQKENIILSVGRFFKQLHSKRQDILVEIFKNMIDQDKKLLKDWKLILIGSVEDQNYFDEIKKTIVGYPIEILTTVSREQLLEKYFQAKIYWHATGYDVNEETAPEKVEHFGIATAEAMAAGAVPLVVGKGGQLEVLGQFATDLSWQTKEECQEKTLDLINHPAEMAKIGELMKKEVKKYELEVFTKKVEQMFS